MMKRNKSALSLLTIVAILGAAVLGPWVRQSEAANLNYVYFMPSRMQVSQASGITWYLALNFPTANMVNPTVTIEFPTGDTGWCDSADTVTVTGTATVPVDQGSWDATLPGGSFSNAACEITGAYSISFDYTGTLNHSTMYGFQIVGNAADLGTDDTLGAHNVIVTIDDGGVQHTSTFAVPLVTDDTVAVNADVAGIPSLTCALSAVSVDFGVLYQNGAYSTVNHTITATPANSAPGYYWLTYGQYGGLFSGTTSDTISSGSSTVDLTSTEGFGATATAPSGATVTTNYLTGTPGQFGSIETGLANANLVMYDQGDPATGGASTITYGARATVADPATDYLENVTWVCGGYY